MENDVEKLAAVPYEFIEDDGEPVGETPLHGAQIFGLITALKCLLAGVDAYIGWNTFFYYDESDWKRSLCPDLYVGYGLGRPLEDLRVFKCWEEPSTPRLILEISSRSTIDEDLYRKKGIYQDVLGVEEYLIFDPEGDVVPERLRAYRLTEGVYHEVGSGPFVSRVVPGTFQVVEGRLRLFDRRGRLLPETAVEGKEQGLQEGKEQGLQEGVRQVLRVRFGAVRAIDEQRLLAVRDAEALGELLTRAMKVSSPDALFE